MAPRVPKLIICTLPTQFGEHEVNALVDTGSTVSLCSENFFKNIKNNKLVVKSIQPASQSATTASGDKIQLTTSAQIHFKIAHFSWTFKFFVASQLPTPVILGANFLNKAKAVIDMAELSITFPYGTNLIMAINPCDSLSTPNQGTYKIGNNLTTDQTQQIRQLIEQFPDTVTKQLGLTHLINYDIQLKETKVVRSRPYQFAPPKLEALRQHVDELLDKGVIRQSSSEYSCPGFLVPKKGNKSRFVVNYKQLNNLINLESTPMPTVESAFQYLGQAKWYTLLDLNSAYMQIPLTERSKKYTAFVVPFGEFEFNVVPFGLSTGSQVLTRLIDKIFGDIKYKYIFNFFDDLVVYTDGSFSQHLKHLKEVITRLQRAGLTVNPEKMTIASNHIEFLGHIFSKGTVTFDSDKIQPIINFPTPKNAKQVSRLIGMMAYYAKFIPNFAQLAAPLNYLKRKNVPFTWGPDQQTSFEQLKTILTSQPILKLPDFNRPFTLQTDGSGTGLGVQLAQEYDGDLYPVAFASRPLNKHEKNRSALELECLAVVFGLTKFQQYLEHREFTLQTDCSALSWLLNHPRQVGKIARWLTFINSFKFTSQHIRGDTNAVADCLSRLYEDNQTEPTTVPMTSPPQGHTVSLLLQLPEAFKDIHIHQREDPNLLKIIRDPHRNAAYSIKDSTLMHLSPGQKYPRIVLPNKLIEMIFKYFHSEPTSAHLGIKKTLNKVNKYFWSPDLNKIITDKVKSCIQCQRAKQSPNTKLGLLSSELSTRPWQKIFIDYVGRLPRSKAGNSYLLSVVDAFSKFIFLLPARNQTASTTVKLLTKHIFSQFGFPEYIVSDNVPSFKSHLMAEMCMDFGIKHIFTSPYNPSANNVERVNKNLKVALRIYHQADHQTWDQNLHWFQVAFNSSKHESTGVTPASLFLGREIKHPLQLAWNLDRLVPSSARIPTELQWEKALESLRHARQKRENYYNRGRIPNPFKPGDWVLYRLHPQSKAVDNINRKLMPQWSKPCVIECFTSPVTVRLINPSTGKFIMSAHISHIKRFFTPKY